MLEERERERERESERAESRELFFYELIDVLLPFPPSFASSHCGFLCDHP